MIPILTNQAVFVTFCVVKIPPLAQGIFILTLNQGDVIGDQSGAVTQNAGFVARSVLPSLERYQYKPGQSLVSILSSVIQHFASPEHPISKKPEVYIRLCPKLYNIVVDEHIGPKNYFY